MTESEWLASDDPAEMTEHKTTSVAGFYPQWQIAFDVCRNDSPAQNTLTSLSNLGIGDPATQAALLREIVGNPFRPVTLPVVCDCCDKATTGKHLGDCMNCGEGTLRCPWLTHADGLVKLAEAAYRERGQRKCGRCKGDKKLKYWDQDGDREGVPCFRWKDYPDCHGSGVADAGTLDPERLAVLADALEDAGCADEDVLRHLRGEERCFYAYGTGKPHGDNPYCPKCDGTGWIKLRGPHVRGCWAVDLLLGKS